MGRAFIDGGSVLTRIDRTYGKLDKNSGGTFIPPLSAIRNGS